MPRRVGTRDSASVFINCPFDAEFAPIFRAMTFAVHDCGFVARCAQEIDDGTQVRLDKIINLIGQCRYAIHDLSRTEADARSGLPRFNMPLELGIFLGAKHFGNGNHKKKISLILDRDRYRYQQFISDIAGQDIHPHGNDPPTAIREVRDWLRASSGRKRVPGGGYIARRYDAFKAALPAMCRDVYLAIDELTFPDYSYLVTNWLKANAVS